MKLFNKVFAVSVGVALLCIQSIAAESDCPCDKILENGLYSHFRISDSGNFSQDFRSYLLSENFARDMRSGKWGTSITVPLPQDAVPLPVSLAANATDSQFQEFNRQIRQAKSFSISESFYQTLVASVPDVDLARVFSDCVEKNCRFGFKVRATFGRDWANFLVSYTSEFSDPLPKVTLFQVINGTRVKSTLQEGRRVENNNAVVCERNPQQDLVFVLQTDHGSVSYKIPADSPMESNKDVPVGTIVASYLNVQQFYLATKCNEFSQGGIWTSEKSKWCPADGRIVPNSLFQKIASQTHVPDLRGMFLRCLNQMEELPQSELNPTRKDQDDRSVGSYQPDSVGPHTHQLTICNSSSGFNNGNEPLRDGVGHPDSPIHVTLNANCDSGCETRPKNIAVFYYVRIN